MLHALVINNPEENLILGIDGYEAIPPDIKFTTSANPVDASGRVLGVIACKGRLYNSVPDLPAFFVHEDGVEIREQYDVKDLITPQFVVAGIATLLKDGKYVKVLQKSTPIPLYKNEKKLRHAIGIRSNGSMVQIINSCTLKSIAIALKALGAVDGLLMSVEPYYENKEVGFAVGKRGVTTIGVKEAKELPRPIIVVDIGHGGNDPGAIAFGLKESSLVLKGGLITGKYLTSNYECSVVYTRKDDSFVDLEARTKFANAIDADFLISLHVNAGGGTGFESYVHPKAFALTRKRQDIIHKTVMNFLSKYGIRDRGRKTANFHMLRESEMSAVLLENLFIDSINDVEFLKNDVKFTGLYNAIGEGVARACGLKKKQTTSLPIKEQKNTLYKVQVGAFKYRQGAEQYLEKLKKLGFDDAFITKE